MMMAITSELDTTIDEAYAEGYKAAAIHYAPEVEYRKTLAESFAREENGFINKMIVGLCGFALGGVAMGIYNSLR
jgi:hypothetical protein